MTNSFGVRGGTYGKRGVDYTMGTVYSRVKTRALGNLFVCR